MRFLKPQISFYVWTYYSSSVSSWWLPCISNHSHDYMVGKDHQIIQSLPTYVCAIIVTTVACSILLILHSTPSTTPQEEQMTMEFPCCTDVILAHAFTSHSPDADGTIACVIELCIYLHAPFVLSITVHALSRNLQCHTSFLSPTLCSVLCIIFPSPSVLISHFHGPQN